MAAQPACGFPACSLTCVLLVQGRVDENGGEWLDMKPDEDVHEFLGDPFVGSGKWLTIHYHLLSKSGQIATRERHAHLAERVHVLAPVVAPMLTYVPSR